MKKSEMKTKAERVLIKITQFELEYKKYRKINALDAETISRINIEELTILKDSLGKSLKLIDALPTEDAPPVMESPPTYTYDDPSLSTEQIAVLDKKVSEWQINNNQRRRYTTLIPAALNSIEKQLNFMMKHLDTFKSSNPDISFLNDAEVELINKQQEFIRSRLELEQEVDSEPFSISPVYAGDAELKIALSQFKQQKSGLANLIKIINADINNFSGKNTTTKLASYENGISLLKTYSDGYQNFSKQVQNRLDVLVSAESVYEEARRAKNDAIESAKRSMASAHVLLRHDDLVQAKKLIGSSDTIISELSTDVKKIADKIRDIEKKNYLTNAGLMKPTPPILDQINSASAQCLQDKGELTQMVAALNKKIVAVEHKVDELEQQVKTDIERQKKEFSGISEIIKNKLTAAKVDTFAIIKLENQFAREESRTNSNSQNSITFDQDKLTNLKKITQELLKQVPLEENRILQELSKNISIIKNESLSRQRQIVTSVEKGGFQFSDIELESVNAVKGYQFSDMGPHVWNKIKEK
ncbi:hypothetical protein TUM19329_16010 [Legionella antarctica]|uniref:Uncharacterized protein n=1 Tax=Legionella antarctica TaxID=2708020 RepID=A0A6F8T511_9GAMM|nr:hypothetical protein [Legionella antarctica]BCA95240.1 hypothetical protein TUM19329_16010 [Legionella antarctica]